MKPFLMGAETEYAVSGRDGKTALDARVVHSLLYRALQRERHWLPDVVAGEALYLENGGRFYLDYGYHPEYATPECFTPQQIAAHDKAGEMLLDLARRRTQADKPGLSLTILKNNLHPLLPDDVTWGSHESYTSWVEPAAAARTLLPHLVSRTIYAGSGCLSAHAGGMGFELSQRARHVHHTLGSDTIGDRALFCTRVRKNSDRSASQGWTRAHLISKDAHRSPFGPYLTYGVTGLLFVLLNERHEVGKGLELAHPLQALRTVSCDPSLRVRVPLADGRKLTALEIQETYREECESVVQRGGLPEWAGEVVRHWGETLATLAKDPLRMARRLDPFYKLFVYEHELSRAGCSWGELLDALQRLSGLRHQCLPRVITALLEGDDTRLTAEERKQFNDARERAQLSRPGVMERLHLAVRLQQFDVAYHEVGGLHDQLTESGHLERVVLSPEDVERATREAPPGGRAAARSALIRRKRDPGWLCEWRYLYHPRSGEIVDMRNPFGDRFESATWNGLLASQPNDVEVQEIAGQIGRHWFQAQ